MDEKTSHKDWALERVRQEALAVRDERYRKNVWAVVLILAVLVVDPFGGVGGLIGSAIGHVFPEPTPAQQAPKVSAPRHGADHALTRVPARPWRSMRDGSPPHANMRSVMDNAGSRYARFQMALRTGRASIAWNAAAKLEHIDLEDALALVLLVVDEPRFERASARLARPSMP
jgi:hypothetical protein